MLVARRLCRDDSRLNMKSGETIMNSATVAYLSPHNTENLRRRAENKLKKELAIGKIASHPDIGQQLYELRVNQIEVELLSEEFNRLRQNTSVRHASYQEQNSSSYGYFVLDRAGRICDAKFPPTDMSVARPQKWSGFSLYDLVSMDMREVLRAFLPKVFESSEKLSCELVFDQTISKKRIGLRLPQYVAIEAVSDDDRQICLAVVEDISARKLADEREKASNAVLAMLDKTIAASRNEIFMFDAKSMRFSFANQRALENLGYTLEELKWLTPADIQTHVFNQEMDEQLDYLLSHKKNVKKLKAVHLRKDGSQYPVEIYLQLFEQETESCFIAIVLDISRQAAIESKLKSIVESADAIIWAADVDLKLEFMSDKVLDILGFNADQFLGSSLRELLRLGFFHESDVAMLNERFNQVIHGGNKVSDLRCRAKQADGTWRWLSVNLTPNCSVDGKVIQVVGVMHDIHAQQLAEDALLKLNQELDFRVQDEIQKNKEKDLLLQRQSRLAGMGEMIGNIAHQWRQPINSLGLILSDLEDAAIYGECDLAYIQTAVEKSKKIIQKMSSTIDDFRHFYRADKSIGNFSLKQVTEECIHLVEAAMESSNINIVIRCEGDVIVNGLANEYSQALMNILINAREAIVAKKTKAGEIIIEIGEDPIFGRHTVTDNGGGIPPEVLPKIFEPHFTTKEHGVGIGLYMTLVSIEKNMDGRIVAENTQDGARFSIYLPKVKAGDECGIH